jgi:hypothetical protein
MTDELFSLYDVPVGGEVRAHRKTKRHIAPNPSACKMSERERALERELREAREREEKQARHVSLDAIAVPFAP